MDSLQKKPVMGVPTCLHPTGMDTIESDRRDEKRLKESQEDVHKYKKIKKKKRLAWGSTWGPTTPI